ncbi:MAG TPA: hypothetical protein VFC74_06180 [Oscillospiraceae bacterium]|nr:hypothetical protein [Oscillospiraceae bacterium]
MIPIPEFYIYPIYTGILALTLIALLPREEIKRLVIYGIVFGAVTDVAIIGVISNLLKVGGHISYYPFGALGVAFFPPLAWGIWFILFFYFLPTDLPWVVIYVFAAVGTSVLFSNVLVNMQIFVWNYGRILVPFLIYGLWFSFAAWAYKRLTKHHA